MDIIDVDEFDDWDSNKFKTMFEAIFSQGEPDTMLTNLEGTLEHNFELYKVQKQFINLSGQIGPNNEGFLDPLWTHCHNEDCELCSKHCLHHGIEHDTHNPVAHQTSIWEQCIHEHGDEDKNGNLLTEKSLKIISIDSAIHAVLGGPPDLPTQTTLSDEEQEKLIRDFNNKEKKKMTHMIKAKGRAKKILNVVARFDDSWRDKGEEGFFNTIRCSPTYLRQFLEALLNNLLKKEAPVIFRDEFDRLAGNMGEIEFKRLDIENLVEDYYNGLSNTQKGMTLDTITNLMIEILNDVIDCHLSSGNNMGEIHRFKTQYRTESDSDPREIMDQYINRGSSGVLDSMFLKAYLTYDNDEGTTLPLSQKARGIHAIGRNTTGFYMFTKLPSLHISLDAANNSSNRELIMSVSRCWMGVRAESTLSKGLYIRTCPATPRPGALPNVLAKTPREFLDGVRMLGKYMTDPTHVDYDPEGCLVVQTFLKPICSGVVVKGSDSFTVGPENDGVTAGGGSNIIFTLNHVGIRQMDKDIKRLDLEDGMEHHEIELVYDSASSSNGMWKPLPLFKMIADQRHQGSTGRVMPTITQMRGLHTAKSNLVPPPMVNGEVLYIRGLIPSGSVEQLQVMDVGKGSLDECIELEQMAKKGELPDGLVVYAPSGTNGAHVAGVGQDYGFPVIFGIKPKKNKTVWTEIQGWVTDIKGAEPQPYSPEPFLDYYKIGLRDGDRFWTYNLAPLSQFFHNFISGPKNDPRLEAYLAGVFTTWIVKAALGVAMGEFRHGIGSNRAKIGAQRAFSHILIQQAIAGESGVSNLFNRSEYYERLNYNELGYDMINGIAKFYSDAYDPEITEWCDGSFGGDKYYASTYPTYDASSLILQMLQGKEVKLQTLLNSVNLLENAVHNTGFFFNKFLGDKDAFDIGTGGHSSFNSACEHWLVTAPFYALFYTNYVNEPHRVAKGHDKLIKHLYAMETQGERDNDDMRNEIVDFVEFASKSGTLKDDITKTPIVKEHEHFYISQLKNDFNMHKQGMCGYKECTTPECKQASMLIDLGIDETLLQKLLDQLNIFMTWSPLTFSATPDSIEKVTNALNSQGSRSVEATTFTESERVVELPEINVSLLDDYVWLLEPKGSSIKWVYIDHLLSKWWNEVEDLIIDLGEEDGVAQYSAWKDPEGWVGEDLMNEVRMLEETLQESSLEGETCQFYSRMWATHVEEFQTPLGLIKSMMVAHEGRYNYNTHSLLQQMHEAGKINENKGEIK